MSVISHLNWGVDGERSWVCMHVWNAGSQAPLKLEEIRISDSQIHTSESRWFRCSQKWKDRWSGWKVECSEQSQVWRLSCMNHMSSLGEVSSFFFGHRFSDGEIGFLEINSDSNPYQLCPLGCCDVRGDSPCPSSFTEPILDHSLKRSSFSFSHSVHATYIYQWFFSVYMDKIYINDKEHSFAHN